MLDKLRSDFGKDSVVAAHMPDSWWAAVGVEEGGEEGASATTTSALSSLSFFSSSSSSPPSSSLAAPDVPPLSLTLLPALKARLPSCFATRCASYALQLHSLLLLSSYPHWPFPRYLLTQLSYIATHAQFALHAECVRLYDQLQAVMEKPGVREMMKGGLAAAPSVYVYTEDGVGEGGGGGGMVGVGRGRRW